LSEVGSRGGRSECAGPLRIAAEVFETAPALGEIGAAVNVAPNATRALIAIGLGDKIAAVGTSSPGIYTRNMQTGEFIEFNDRRKTPLVSARRTIRFTAPIC
jgi:2-polyprenyl-6-methoxyphenol hydroxylase-like FAD-dependent oxidoreductase